jgi:hypothetical protein
MMKDLAPALVVTLLGTSVAAHAQTVQPFERTEQRAACKNYVPTRQPLFGELHIHTQYSADASTLDTRNTPREAYQFAKGNVVGLPPFVNTKQNTPPNPIPAAQVSAHPYCLPPEQCQFTATRTVQLRRPLDFTAVTDHSEWLGEAAICFFEPSKSCMADGDCPPGQTCVSRLEPDNLARDQVCAPRGYHSAACVLAREDVSRLRTGLGSQLIGSTVIEEMRSARWRC